MSIDKYVIVKSTATCRQSGGSSTHISLVVAGVSPRSPNLYGSIPPAVTLVRTIFGSVPTSGKDDHDEWFGPWLLYSHVCCFLYPEHIKTIIPELVLCELIRLFYVYCAGRPFWLPVLASRFGFLTYWRVLAERAQTPLKRLEGNCRNS